MLRHLRQGPQRASQIVSRCDVTKQAVSQQIAHLERNGYVTVEPDPHDQRARLLSLTAKGEAAQRLLEEIFDDVERAWADQVGEKDIESLRRILGEVPGATPGAC